MKPSLPVPAPEEQALSAELAHLIGQEIDAAGGAIPFSRWMERALYAPGLGYYSSGRRLFGAEGDFVTAPELGELFGRTLARALAPALRELGPQAAFLELGGGSGAFAAAVLPELERLDALPAHWWMLEPSAALAARQREALAELGPALAGRVEWLSRPPEQAWRGVLFANEVIDALPATRFAIADGEVMEEFVLRADQGFARSLRPADSLVAAAVRHVEHDIGRALPDGYRSEILPQLPYWMQAVLGKLEAGVALFVDYGYPRPEYYLAERRDGTLVSHYRHHAHGDPFHLPGLTDLTAFVDFTALAEAGTGAGFDFVGYAPQGRFLLASGLAGLVEEATGEAGAGHLARAAEAKRLTLPGDMGERFQAMAFARGLDDPLPGLVAMDRSHRL